MKSELKVNDQVSYILDTDDSYTTSDGKTYKYVSLKKITKQKSGKPKWQILTISHDNEKAISEWLQKCFARA